MGILLQLPVLSILDPFVSLMGIIINYIYKFLLMFGITKVAVCIIVFTIVIKLLMLPLTYKQQKFTKVSAVMNPELQAIQEKYKGKRDNDSMLKMQSEQQEIYKKYGASPMSGCLPMIIIMVILFALYPVIYSIPTYVDDVKTYYSDIVTVITKDEAVKEEIDGYTLSDAIYSFYNIRGVYVRKAPKFEQGETVYTRDNYIAIMAGFSEKDWNIFFSGEELEDSGKIEAAAWNAYAPYISNALNKEFEEKDGNVINPAKVKDEIVNINTFFTLNIFDKPQIKSITVLIPILSALLQYLQTQISMALNKTDDSKKKKKKPGEVDPMDTMKTMNVVMPIFSGIITLSLPIGVGIYWITSALVSIILQLIINLKLKKMDIQIFIDESAENKKKSLEKAGVHTKNDSNMARISKISTKTIDSASGKSSKNQSVKEYVISEEKRHLKSTDIAGIANLYNSDYVSNKNSDEESGDKGEN